MDKDEMTELVNRELSAMENHGEFFEPLNIFYKLCLHNVEMFLD